MRYPLFRIFLGLKMKQNESEYLQSIAAQALEVETAQRDAFIVSACHGDPNAVRAVLDRIRSRHNESETQSTATVGLGGDHNGPTQDRSFVLGQVIDNRLRIVRFISEGGMGEVYAALDLNLHENVALKTIRSDVAEHPGVIERFKTEVKQSLRITHPNVCRVHQLAMYQDQSAKSIWYLTMELLEGPTLARSLAANGAIPPARALALINQMVAGLACAHDAGIIHRDLKPSNIMLVGLVPNERLVITDFGLAVSVSSRAEGGLFGTPAYMAPEQRTGGPIGPQADVFALGLIICEMLTGEPPRLNLQSAENCSKQLKAWLTAHRKLPPGFVSVIKRCLQFRPEDRFADAGEIIPLLETKRRITPERVAIALIALAGLFAVGGMLLTRMGERIVNAVKLTPEGSVSAGPSLSADGTYVAYISNRADPGNLDIWLQSTSSGDARRLTINPAEDAYPSISPDGRLVAFRSERNGGAVYLIGSDGKSERLLVPGGRNPAFSPNGRAIAYWLGSEDMQRSGELYLYSIDGGPPRRVVSDFDDARYPTWTYDGLLLFFGCPAAETASCPEWWVVDANGSGAPTNTGVAALLRSQQIALDFPPKLVWNPGHILVSGRRGRTFHIWDILLSFNNHRAVGQPGQITFGDIDERALTSAGNGVIALEHVSGALHLWRIAAGPAGNQSVSEKLTDNVQTDCCPAVSRDARWLFFTRRLAEDRQLIKLDLLSGKESTVYESNQDKLWPLPSSSGDLVVFESRSANRLSIVLWKQDGVRTVCEPCSHPSAWVSDGKELLYTTAAGDIGILDIVTGQSRSVVPASRGYVLSYPDWNPQNQHLLFTASKGGVKQVFAASLPQEDAKTASNWIPLTSGAESADLARWSADGKDFFYFSRKDGFYCVWENSFDPASRTTGNALPVKHYHDWGKGPSRAAPHVLGMSVAKDWIYINVGEASATVWQGRLQRNLLSDYVRRVFQR
jgi:eukaryotic-like serine/threonine-protein kinase